MEELGFGVELPGFSASYHLPKDPGQMTFSLNFILPICKMGMIVLFTRA